MLKPSMNELMKRVGNRYLLVNLAAQRARDIAQESEHNEEPLHEKVVKLALDEIAAGTIVHRPGKKIEQAEIFSARDLSATIDLDFDDDALIDEDDELLTDEQEEE